MKPSMKVIRSPRVLRQTGFPSWGHAAYYFAKTGIVEYTTGESQSVELAAIPGLVIPLLEQLEFLERRFPDPACAVYSKVQQTRVVLASLSYLGAACEMAEALPQRGPELLACGIVLRDALREDEEFMVDNVDMSEDFFPTRRRGDRPRQVGREIAELLEVVEEGRLFGVFGGDTMDRRIFDAQVVAERLGGQPRGQTGTRQERIFREHLVRCYPLAMQRWSELRDAVSEELGDATRAAQVVPAFSRG